MDKLNSEAKEEAGGQKSSKGSGVTIRPLDDSGEQVTFDKTAVFNKKTLIIYLVLMVIGALVGGGVYAVRSSGTGKVGGRRVEVVKSPTEEGVKDPSVYKDTATGKLIANDSKVTSEGTHILVRGDVSQNVYVTSTIVDLAKYENKVVQVWGQTYQGSDPKTGWLIDVGSIKIVD